MPPEDIKSGSPQDWLRRAKSNLARAKQPKADDVVWEDLCFDAQQAAEKGVKAVLISHGIDFPKSHNIRSLLILLQNSGKTIAPDLWEAAQILTPYAVGGRYPSEDDPVTETEYLEAITLAEGVFRWAESLLSP